MFEAQETNSTAREEMPEAGGRRTRIKRDVVSENKTIRNIESQLEEKKER